MPIKSFGIVTELSFAIGADSWLKPVKNAANRSPVELPLSNLRVTFWPGFEPAGNSSVGKALKGRGGFDDGHDLMKGTARLKTSFGLRGTSRAPLHGLTLLTAPVVTYCQITYYKRLKSKGITCNPACVARFGGEN